MTRQNKDRQVFKQCGTATKPVALLFFAAPKADLAFTDVMTQ